MSDTPNWHYGYGPQSYYMDEPKGYMADYSDNDAFADNQQVFQQQQQLQQRSQQQLQQQQHQINPNLRVPVFSAPAAVESNPVDVYGRKNQPPASRCQTPAYPQQMQNRYPQNQQLYLEEILEKLQMPRLAPRVTNVQGHALQQPYRNYDHSQNQNQCQGQNQNQAYHHQQQFCPIANAEPVVQRHPVPNGNWYANGLPNMAEQQRPSTVMDLNRFALFREENEANQRQAARGQHLQMGVGAKKYPVTVGTPKYYRRAASNSLYKRPSALCLPVASQPDPAMQRRPKRPYPVEGQYEGQLISDEKKASGRQEDSASNFGAKNDVSNVLTVHTINSEGDVNTKMSTLQDMLQKFEKDNETLRLHQSKEKIMNFARGLKPRVPSSVRVQRERMQRKLNSMKFNEDEALSKKKAEESANNDEANDLNSANHAAGDSLEKLLNQLKKCELAASRDVFLGTNNQKEEENEEGAKSDEAVEQIQHEQRDAEEEGSVDMTDEKSDDFTEDEKPMNKKQSMSFNYHEIADKMAARSRSECRDFVERPAAAAARGGSATQPNTPPDAAKRYSTHSLASASASPAAKSSAFAKQPLDDNCALELHRSKSYIVNLIDRALSKELGTIPSDRTWKQFSNMSPQKAIDLVNRHAVLNCHKTDKDLCLEITSALADSMVSNATAPSDGASVAGGPERPKTCHCSSSNLDEPNYIKQLKQLRWGHLKHIQREVRRLEDLERFLDSCSSCTIPEE